jgi:hypothetical protein
MPLLGFAATTQYELWRPSRQPKSLERLGTASARLAGLRPSNGGLRLRTARTQLAEGLGLRRHQLLKLEARHLETTLPAEPLLGSREVS